MSSRASARTASLEPGTLIVGKYRLDTRLAGGGMGSVWKGWDLRLDTPVAIKFMRADLAADPIARGRFEREAKAAAQIRSPYVVHMYDHGVQQGAPYLVMELLEGEDLQQRLRREPWLRLSEVLRIGSEIGKGLGRAHALGIVHRDLKPANVFLSAPDEGLVKLLDFGIAKTSGIVQVAGESTQTGQLVGSPHYMSPEQVRGVDLDARSDLWALGVVLYRLLTGKRPFEGTDLGDLAVRICTERHRAASEIRPSLGANIDRFFDCALAKEREHRFGTAAELVTAFAAEVQTCYAMFAGAEPAPAPASGTEPGGQALAAPVAWPTAATGTVPQTTAAFHPEIAPASSVDATLQTRITQGAMSLGASRAAQPVEIPSGSIASGFGIEPRAALPRPGLSLWIAGAAASLLIGAAVAYLAVSARSGTTSEDGPSGASAVETPTAQPTEPSPDAATQAPNHATPGSQSSGTSSSSAPPAQPNATPTSGATGQVAHATASARAPGTRPTAASASTAAPATTNTRGQILGY